MKIARTFTIDVNVAQDLKQKLNQSQFVEDAIKAKLYPSFTPIALNDAPKVSVLYQLLRLYDEDSYEWKKIHEFWEIENKKHIKMVQKRNKNAETTFD